MTAIRKWLATLGVFALGGTAQIYAQPAEAQVTTAEIERACELALQANTIEAIEDFLHKYPPSKYRNDVACYALALGTLNDFGPNGNNLNDNPGNNNGGYGD